MYRIFGQNLKNYFLINRDGDPESAYRIKIAQVLRGLSDYELYRRWEKEKPEAFNEINNLVQKIKESTDKYPRFEAFSYDLWGYGYQAVQNGQFSEEDIQEQLKLIDLCLGTQYWI